MKNYIKLIRIKHWIKNFLIFIPLIFSGLINDKTSLITCFFGFLAFNFAASIIYIINDIKDIEKDRLHEVKKNRPLASGKISIKNAIITCGILLIFAIIFTLLAKYYINSYGFIYLIVYLIINIGYSMGLKNIPIIDILILVAGFVLRVLYGAELINVEVSNWLYLTIMSFSFYLGLGKRRNEFSHLGTSTRKVLESYNIEFLDKFMYLFLALTIVFYSLWATDPSINNLMIWTIPIVITICMKYSLVVEGSSLGDPTEVLLSDKILIFLCLLYAAFMLFILYF